MSARIARGGPARGRPKPRGRTNARGTGKRKAKQPGLLESFGISPGWARRLGNWALAGMTLSVVVAAILAFRLPQLAGIALGEGVGGAGFTLRRVEITGNQRVSTLDIYNVAFDQDSMAMPLIDLAGTRARLLRFGWIRDVQVSRRLPDTLVVHVVERLPVAIWQNSGQLSLIDGDGVVLEPVQVAAMPDLPLVIGAGANRHINNLAALIEAAPRLRPQIAGATWMGQRRWDIRFQSGETLSLPEGDEEARRAITRFAMMDQQNPLLGQNFARIDMRDPRRTYVRISREPGAIVPALAPPDPGQPPQDLSRTI
ncbi:MAG: cell division protein FtsQ [Sphingomonadales bacterium]|jgi:cell division protein FtsQ|nr:cell division protein FtsQ [Sphingomonadales bacterium]MEA3045564.1 cell division protein FtsQ [Sphingomonadales bacterium]